MRVAFRSLFVLAGIGTMLSGCGSSDQPPPDGRASVESLIREVFTHKDPGFCKSAMTPRFLDQNYGQNTDDPLQECRFEDVLPGEPGARQVSFRAVRVTGNRAVATAALTGGNSDGAVLRIELVKDADRWKLDHYADIQIDRPRFDAATRRELAALGSTPSEARCAVQRLRRFYDTEELERAYLSGKTDGFSAAIVLCLGRKTLVEQLRLAIRKSAPRDLPDPIVECLGRRITEGASTNLLRAIYAASDKLEAFIERALGEAARACAKDAEAGLLPQGAAS